MVNSAINSGVPQESVIGPTLFPIFINDLPDCILSKLAIYADDAILYFSLDRTKDLFDKIELAADLKDDLRIVVKWGICYYFMFLCYFTYVVVHNYWNCIYIGVSISNL